MSNCERCGSSLAADAEPWPANYARTFALREREGPFFGPFRQALDFSAGSLRWLDAVLDHYWGTEGMAREVAGWKPPPGKLQIILNLGAYLGEVLCQFLPAQWRLDPQQPQHLPGARVVDRRNRLIDPFVPVAARVRDGARVRLSAFLAEVAGQPVPSLVRLPATQQKAAAEVLQLLQEADAAVACGLTEQAIGRYRAVLERSPDHAEARRELANALASLADFDAAIRELDVLKRKFPTDPFAAETRAQVLSQAGRMDEAMGAVEMALMKHPAHPALKRMQALLRLRARQWPRAQQALEALLAQRPDDAEIRIGLAHALKEQGQVAAGVEHLRKILALPAIYRPPLLEQLARDRLASWTQS